MITLIVLDGFGLTTKQKGNAITKETAPHFFEMWERFPHTTLNASGEAVGLDKLQMGNSEVGHLTMGAGRVFKQDLKNINDAIKSGEFNDNKVILNAIKHCKQNNSILHLMGLVSNGGVHSHVNHLLQLIKLAKKYNVNYVIHAFTDGRDSGIMESKQFLKQVEKTGGKIVSIIGRVFAMDRENRWDRVEKAFDMLTLGKADLYETSVQKALKYWHNKNITDEFLPATIIGQPQNVNSNDSVLFFNFRSDRARELAEAFTNKSFSNFKVKNMDNLYFAGFAEYDQTQKNVNVCFPSPKIENPLAKIIADANLLQFHCSETTKYAHVSFFFNGGHENPFKGEDRKLIESINTQNFVDYPEMRAEEIMQEVLTAISSQKYAFILVNFSNADIIGHSGNFEQTKKAIKCVDRCASCVALSTMLAGGEAIITADHGNAEEMLDKNGNSSTTHSCNKVPFLLFTNKLNINLKQKKGISCVAPTILKLLNLPVPNEMDEPLF
ncbi:MAG: 2,3-bisphosphoglycerate-independent phosphoglycerate mutase [Clostridia bacterium]